MAPIILFPSCLVPTGVLLPSDVFSLPGCTWEESTLSLQIHPRPQHLCSMLSVDTIGLLPETCSRYSVVLGSVILINTSPVSRILLCCRMLSHSPQSTTRDPAGFRTCLFAHPWKNSAALLGHLCCSMPSRILWSGGWKSRLSVQVQESL